MSKRNIQARLRGWAITDVTLNDHELGKYQAWVHEQPLTPERKEGPLLNETHLRRKRLIR